MKNSILITLAIYTLTTGCLRTQSEPIPAHDHHYNSVDEMIEVAKQSVTEIKSKDFMAHMEAGEPFILIDVRTKAEHDAGYIPGAINMPRGVIEFRIDNEAVWDGLGMYMPEKTELIVLYCKKGHRGTLAAKTLQELGYSNVKNISGGWLEWLTNFPDWSDKNETTGAALPAAGGGGGC